MASDHLPPFTGYDSNTLIHRVPDQLLGLPPFLVAGIGDVEDVPVLERQTPAGYAAVFRGVVLEQSPASR